MAGAVTVTPNSTMNIWKYNAFYDDFWEQRISVKNRTIAGIKKKEQVFGLLPARQSYLLSETLILSEGMSYIISGSGNGTGTLLRLVGTPSRTS